MEVLRGERMLNEIASENNVHPNMLTRWKTDAVNNFHILFENENANLNHTILNCNENPALPLKRVNLLIAIYRVISL